MCFITDHDPIPLLGQLQQRFAERLEIKYQQRDPEGVLIHFNIVI